MVQISLQNSGARKMVFLGGWTPLGTNGSESTSSGHLSVKRELTYLFEVWFLFCEERYNAWTTHVQTLSTRF